MKVTDGLRRVESSVIIVGAGPVGMTLALDLALRGVDVAVVEKRARDAAPRQRCNHISARTMEIFRRLGIAAEIRNAGLPEDYPHDVSYATSLTGYELTRIRIPARKDRFGSTGYADSGWPTPEPPHRCNQMYFEPILQRHMLSSPRIQVFYETEVVTADQDGNGVTVRGRAHTGEEILFAGQYLVGCDGGSSLIRKTVGAVFEGTDSISRTRSVFVRAPALQGILSNEPAWMTWFVNPAGLGNAIALNGTDLWVFHFWLSRDSKDFDSVDIGRAIHAAVGAEIPFEVVSVDDWHGRRLVATRFRDRRMFICGDAAHIWIPFAGYGMNAGIADAMNLSWQLAAAVKGWAGPMLLDGYEAERHPVTEQVSQAVMALALSNLDVEFVSNPPPELLLPGPEGDAVRARAGQYFYDANLGQFACLGLNFGTYYDKSPIIAYDGEMAPAYSLTGYVPSTVPGCRTPHLWLADGSSLYDRLGPDFTLLRFDPAVDVSRFLAMAERLGVPLDVLDVSSEDAGAEYDHKLVLSRPDQHIAWRGDEAPEDLELMLERIRGGQV